MTTETPKKITETFFERGDPNHPDKKAKKKKTTEQKPEVISDANK